MYLIIISIFYSFWWEKWVFKISLIFLSLSTATLVCISTSSVVRTYRNSSRLVSNKCYFVMSLCGRDHFVFKWGQCHVFCYILFCFVGHHNSPQPTKVWNCRFKNRYVLFGLWSANVGVHRQRNVIVFGLLLSSEAELFLGLSKPLCDSLLLQCRLWSIQWAVWYWLQVYILMRGQFTPPCKFHVPLAVWGFTWNMLISTSYFKLNVKWNTSTTAKLRNSINSSNRINALTLRVVHCWHSLLFFSELPINVPFIVFLIESNMAEGTFLDNLLMMDLFHLSILWYWHCSWWSSGWSSSRQHRGWRSSMRCMSGWCRGGWHNGGQQRWWHSSLWNNRGWCSRGWGSRVLGSSGWDSWVLFLAQTKTNEILKWFPNPHLTDDD